MADRAVEESGVIRVDASGRRQLGIQAAKAYGLTVLTDSK